MKTPWAPVMSNNNEKTKTEDANQFLQWVFDINNSSPFYRVDRSTMPKHMSQEIEWHRQWLMKFRVTLLSQSWQKSSQHKRTLWIHRMFRVQPLIYSQWQMDDSKNLSISMVNSTNIQYLCVAFHWMYISIWTVHVRMSCCQIRPHLVICYDKSEATFRPPKWNVN